MFFVSNTHTSLVYVFSSISSRHAAMTLMSVKFSTLLIISLLWAAPVITLRTPLKESKVRLRFLDFVRMEECRTVHFMFSKVFQSIELY